jgi:hypothetical protein
MPNRAIGIAARVPVKGRMAMSCSLRARNVSLVGYAVPRSSMVFTFATTAQPTSQHGPITCFVLDTRSIHSVDFVIKNEEEGRRGQGVFFLEESLMLRFPVILKTDQWTFLGLRKNFAFSIQK